MAEIWLEIVVKRQLVCILFFYSPSISARMSAGYTTNSKGQNIGKRQEDFENELVSRFGRQGSSQFFCSLTHAIVAAFDKSES